jgi:hypothetical protein
VWASGPVWMGLQNLAPTRVWTMDCPACSELLYRLDCPSRKCNCCVRIVSLDLSENREFKIWYYVAIMRILYFIGVCCLGIEDSESSSIVWLNLVVLCGWI